MGGVWCVGVSFSMNKLKKHPSHHASLSDISEDASMNYHFLCVLVSWSDIDHRCIIFTPSQ